MTTATRLFVQARTRLIQELSDDRGDGPVDQAIIIGLGVTLALLVVAAATAALNKYVVKIF